MLVVALRRWGAWAVVADGLVWLAYGLITREFAPTYWSATRFIDYVAVDLYSGGLLLLAIGLAAIHAPQAGQAGPFERVAFLVACAGAVLAGVGDLAEDGLRFAAASAVWSGGVLVLVAGLLLFGIASLRASVLPVGCSVLLILSPVVGSFGGLSSNWGGTVAFGLVWVTLGCLLMRHKSQTSLNEAVRR